VTVALAVLVAVVAFGIGGLLAWWWRGATVRAAPAAPARLDPAAPERSRQPSPGPDAAAAAVPAAAPRPQPQPLDPTPGTGISSAVGPAGQAGAPAWSAVVDKLPLGVVVMTRSGEIRYRNPQANSMAGTHTGLLIDNAVKEALLRAVRGEHSHQTLEFYGPPQVAVVVVAEPLPEGAAVATIEDVSDRRRVDAVRTDFVANISHELKTPVGALAVLAEALLDEADTEVVHRVAERMATESHRVARTIDDLMELSRIELGEQPIGEAVAVDDVVHEAIERARGLAESKEIDIAVLEVPAGVRLVGDRRQLVSALGNLVENAVKYSEAHAKVQIRVLVEGLYAELMVADQGIGIPPGEQDRIFERFYRVDKARSRDTGGTGLGLSIVRHVATNHGGEVLVSSQEGEGSTFVLRIPVAAMPGADPPRTSPDVPADNPGVQPT